MENNNVFDVNISVETFADLYIDREKIADNNSIRIEKGRHEVSTRLNGEEYNQDINIEKDNQNIDANICGKIILKGASNVDECSPLGNAPLPRVSSAKNGFVITDMLGEYELKATSGIFKFLKVSKKVNIGKRSSTTYHIDEMVPFIYVTYHGQHLQPFGFSIGGTNGKFGWYFSYCTDAKSKIKTPYGDAEFTDDSSSDKKLKNTSYNLATGPMFKIYRKLFGQVGGGMVRYLSTSQKKVLTPDYKYKFGGMAEVSLIFRFKAFIIGAGYTYQFVSKAYNPAIASQVSFNIGVAL